MPYSIELPIQSDLTSKRLLGRLYAQLTTVRHDAILQKVGKG